MATIAGLAITGTPASAASGFTAADLAHVKAQITKYEQVPTFKAPGPSIDAGKLKGQSVFNVPQSTSNPFLSVTDAAMASIAKSLGLSYTEYSNPGATSDWITGIDEAVSQKADAISLNALDPRLVGPQVTAAKSAGIPSTSEQFFDLTQVEQRPSNLAAVRADNFAKAGRLEADWAILQTKGKAKVLVVENREEISTIAMASALGSEFKTFCPTCSVTYLNVPATEWATRIQPGVQAALVQNPNINFVIPLYDPMAQFVIPAIIAAGDTKKVQIATFNGTPAALKDLEQGNVITMDIGENLSWLAYANMDEIMRTMLKVKPLANENTPFRIFTKNNIDETGTPPAFNEGFGNSYITGYDKLWGVSGS
jgi:ribose transport system substrate-binding protein